MGFRYFVYDNAIKLGLKGYVKNSNGGVEAVFDGDDMKITEIVGIIKTKHPTAYVRSVETEVLNGLERFEGFKVRK